MWRIPWVFTECTQPVCEQRTLNPRPIIQRHLLVERFVERCFRFHFQARNSARRSRNQVMNYILGISISRRTEWDPTSMSFFISEDSGPKKCHFCFRFHFRARNSARRSMNPGMKYLFGISSSRRTEWHPTSMIFFISNEFSLKKCHFCSRFHFRARNSARRSMNPGMKYIFRFRSSRRTKWVPTSLGFFDSNEVSLLDPFIS